MLIRNPVRLIRKQRTERLIGMEYMTTFAKDDHGFQATEARTSQVEAA